MEHRLKLSKRTEYGLRALVQLARAWPTHYMQSRDLARQEKLPNKFLEAILLALRRGGFLESKVGMGGGYRLTRPPRDIKVSDLIKRLEGRPTPADSRPPEHPTAGQIALQFVASELTGAISDAMDSLTLEELVEQVNRRMGASEEMYYI
jgi:Rrf2 family protein